MYDFYPEIRLAHISAVALSGALFFLRGLALLAGASWPRAAPLRYASYTVDTVLLTAALMLMTIIGQYPFVDAWLSVKLLLLILYIVLGVLAFLKGRSTATRATLWGAALAVFLFIISVALSHHPLGVFAG